MKKALIWFVAGFIAATTISAHAEVINMIGKVVQGEIDLTINNQKMEYSAVNIDGTTYAPVRMLGEATGYIVKYNESTGIKLIKKITTPKSTVLKSIEVLNGSIERNNNAISRAEQDIAELKNGPQSATVLMDIQAAEESIKVWEKSIIGLNEQIAKLNQSLREIEAQEADLAE